LSSRAQRHPVEKAVLPKTAASHDACMITSNVKLWIAL
jgi:hypothetical protein